MSEGKKGAEALGEIGLRLGGLAETLRQTFEQVARTAGEARDVTIETPAGPLHARSQVRVRVGGLAAAAETAAERDFEVTPTQSDAAPRAPVVDTFEEEAAFVVTAELPGVAEEDLSILAEAGSLLIEAGGPRPYRAVVALPDSVDPQRLERRLVNGILEVRLPKEIAP